MPVDSDISASYGNETLQWERSFEDFLNGEIEQSQYLMACVEKLEEMCNRRQLWLISLFSRDWILILICLCLAFVYTLIQQYYIFFLRWNASWGIFNLAPSPQTIKIELS